MSQTYGAATETIQGTVEQTNGKGIKLHGRWYNYSQFSAVTTRPEEGDTVEAEIAKGRFINALTVTSGGLPTGAADGDDPFGDPVEALDAAGGALVTRPTTGTKASGPRRAAAAPPSEGDSAATASATISPAVDRNTEIRRLALLKAAADYAAGRLELTPEEVLAIATRWEAWVTSRSDRCHNGIEV
jgi:hypothetical protein